MKCAQCDREDRQKDLPTVHPPQTFEPCGHLRPYKATGIPSAVNTILAIMAAIAGAWMLAGCTVLRCDKGAVCDGQTSIFSGPSSTPTPTPSPSPAPSLSPTPAPCKADAIVASLAGGSQLAEIAVTDTPKRLDATAFNASGEIPTGCHLARFPVWEVRTPATCAILGSGWNPHLDGIRVGACEVRACLRQSGDGACFSDRLAGESSPVTSPVFSVVVR